MNAFVIADASQCIGCRTCEIACAVAHTGGGLSGLNTASFAPRLKVIKSAEVSVPVLCHQCENAPCASACPQEALVAQNDSIQVISSRCIGCKSCVIACPFGAIQIAAAAQGEARSEVRKCDLCHGVADGPSCVRVCPTSALRLVTPDDLRRQREKRQWQSAGENIHSHSE
ncbi:4Fe-4S dicluster domain-containing protein [Lonsdalea populi]|uniref:4Fe-4S dicluster domain-containing protein n=1 Tax=Lonsdalea populi TaxID=1172565 RepID=UPI000A1E005C|nr:4Fe-4S dicluster domain-containing protein [Lonsdalea populi]OSN00715.1 effector protein [Lonsdalea populi]QPQ24225.1 4Fe-4S dicluster domain-containing protein [Lonsdalea populi]RAT42709.1 effector protein [Lonsdalea populi]RAT45908.1 effector protein [Lonsdalea populi]RAT57235.1 effector protein [Lonsdalea populi]